MLRLNVNFFETLANTMGNFINMDENFREGYNIDVFRFLIMVPLSFRLVEGVSVFIDNESFGLSLRKALMGLSGLLVRRKILRSIVVTNLVLRSHG